ncbi:DUF4301 family protein [Nonlabens ponticola]|uniref:DUF4301 family protein n=1 Tax=Nonlabens ponticola TaxID=2496866 RepID=A0A3S9MVT2_9FLAO|nr:DUF4301 family protein [Nonlabens ponticola]AZQ43290.1 DUF4301 family protein [Nonlabens ponticola]
MKLTTVQEQQLKDRDIPVSAIEYQLNRFKNGFPLVTLVREATVGDGIARLSDENQLRYKELYSFRQNDISITKFVPASGAASRMFKFLHEFVAAYDSDKETIASYIERNDAALVEKFTNGWKKFPFSNIVLKHCRDLYADWNDLSLDKQQFYFAKAILDKDQLNYSGMAKGLVPFHNYGDHIATAFEEHLYEAASYAPVNNKAQVHFTIAPDAQTDFKTNLEQAKTKVENETGVKLDVTFSFQKPSTDTLAVSLDLQPLTDSNGEFILRPAGHGALLQNLNDLEAQLIFIKNIDNVASRSTNSQTSHYKQVIAGLLIELQDQTHTYIRALQEQKYKTTLEKEIVTFLQQSLSVTLPDSFEKSIPDHRKETLIALLNRPVRVCGMVKNQGEPGGGPFWVKEPNGAISLQIVESAQVDPNDNEQQSIASRGTHFNPVDVVCGMHDYMGNPFDLNDFSDPDTGFITTKSRLGRKLKGQELPGLWNGGMALWNTVFVEVPLETFNPVKTVNDLLKPAHQA